MAVPTLTPVSQISAVVLTPTGTHSDVIGNLVFGIYDSAPFVSGAVDQVAYTYKKLGGDILDVEISASQVYAAYEEFSFRIFVSSKRAPSEECII